MCERNERNERNEKNERYEKYERLGRFLVFISEKYKKDIRKMKEAFSTVIEDIIFYNKSLDNIKNEMKEAFTEINCLEFFEEFIEKENLIQKIEEIRNNFHNQTWRLARTHTLYEISQYYESLIPPFPE